jgi:hypothetical protein
MLAVLEEEDESYSSKCIWPGNRSGRCKRYCFLTVRKASTRKMYILCIVVKKFALSDCVEKSVMKISTDNEFEETVVV